VFDPGSYRYNAVSSQWRNTLALPDSHNGPQTPMLKNKLRQGLFLWKKWPKAQLCFADTKGKKISLQGSSNEGFVRDIEIKTNKVTVYDKSRSTNSSWFVRWVLPAKSITKVRVIKGCQNLIRPSEDSPLGWFSPNYGKKLPGHVLVVKKEKTEPSQIITEFSFKS